MRAWLLFLAVLATFELIVAVASTEEHIQPVIDTSSDKTNLNKIQIETLDNEHSSMTDNSNANSNSNTNTKTKSSAKARADRVKYDPETLVKIEKSFLSRFGMKQRPKVDRSKIEVDPGIQALYEEQLLNQEEGLVHIRRPGLHTKTANTVTRFTHEESKIDKRFQHHHKFRLHFNITSIPNHEQLKAAELNLSRNAIETLHANRTRYQVLVYDILQLGVKGKREPSYRLLDSKSVRLNTSEAVSLDVYPAVERWIASPKANYGLLIEVRTALKLRPAPHQHVRLRRDVSESDESWKRQQPLLFTYTDDGKEQSRTKRDVSRPKRAHHKSKKMKPKEMCQRKPLYVDFSDVGWRDWIVAPPGYEAYYCQGECPFPLADHFNSTNHAVVQTLVNSVNPAKVAKPCCVPTQLTGISMLYLNENNQVVLKNYQDMTVVGCGCR